MARAILRSRSRGRDEPIPGFLLYKKVIRKRCAQQNRARIFTCRDEDRMVIRALIVRGGDPVHERPLMAVRILIAMRRSLCTWYG
jgi:hypothetical protein